MHLLRRSTLGVMLGALACGDDGGPNPNPTPASITITSGSALVGPAGQPLATPLRVVVRDAANSPVAGVTVTWAAATGGGAVNPPSSNTDGSGIASTTRILGPAAGTQTTTATVSGLTPVTFSSVAQIQGATQLVIGTGNNQTDTVLSTLSEPLSVIARDQNGAPVQGVVINWFATGGGSVSTPTSTTNLSGSASISRTFGAAAGAYGAQAAVTGLAGSPVTFTLTATAGNAATLVKTSGDNGIVAPSGQAIYVVTARDAHGNPKSGVTVDWAVASGGGSVAPASNSTAANGTASATHTLSATLGAQTVTATAPGLTGSPATFTTTAANVTNVAVGGATSVFNPANVTIALNGTVVWTWAAGNILQHNITFAATAGAPLDVPNQATGSANRTFGTAGTFNYQCINHPTTMTGSVNVTP